MRRLVVIAVVLFAVALPANASAYIPHLPLTNGNYPLRVDEAAKRFDATTTPLVVNSGIVRFSVLVPPSASGQHGVGIDGGRYVDIRGASVKPGRVTSLTVGLEPGNYTIFDSYKNNRERGYAIPIIAVEGNVTRPEGKRCSIDLGFGIGDTAWQTRSSCRRAGQVAESVDRQWRKSGFLGTAFVARSYRCTLEPVTAIGLTTTCARGSSRIIFAR